MMSQTRHCIKARRWLVSRNESIRVRSDLLWPLPVLPRTNPPYFQRNSPTEFLIHLWHYISRIVPNELKENTNGCVYEAFTFLCWMIPSLINNHAKNASF